MANVGDKLEEARKRLGISIREAAEATKIRSEYLLNFENENFDFDLPDVYKRGFVKMYARYLKIDIDKFMTDVDAVMLGRTKGKSGAREFFGRMDLPANNKDSAAFSPFSEEESGVGVPQRSGSGSAHVPAAERLEQGIDKTLYWKIALIFVGTVIVVGLVAMLIQSLFKSGEAPQPTTPSAQTTTAQGGSTQPYRGVVTIVGLGNARVIVQELGDTPKVLFNQDVENGKRYPIERNGNIRVVSTNNIENIGVEIDGKLHRAPVRGQAQWFFDAKGPYTPSAGGR